MWKLEPTEEYGRRAKQFEKKFKRELVAVLDNLDTYFKAIAEGANPLIRAFGFMHPEPMGVVAITEKGGGKNLKATRLYVYAEIETKVLHVITLGDKNRQEDEILYCKQFVQSLRKIRDYEQQAVQQRSTVSPPHFGRPEHGARTSPAPASSPTGKETDGNEGG